MLVNEANYVEKQREMHVAYCNHNGQI